MNKLPRYLDYMDPSKRPLVTNVQVLEYRPTGRKDLLDLKTPDITGVEYCEIPFFKRDQRAVDDPHSDIPSFKVHKSREVKMDNFQQCEPTARMRPDPAIPRYVEVSTAHKCPPGYTDTRTARRSPPGRLPKECPAACADVLADYERRSRERRQMKGYPGDLKIGEPKICPPGYQSERQNMCARAQPGGKQKQCAMKQNRCTQGGMGAREQRGMAMGGMVGPKMCPPKFSVGLCPNSDKAQDKRCAVNYKKCAPKMRPGVCGPSKLGHNPLGSRERTKSRELIGGVLLTGCDCIKRNGLQHDCKRSLCQGRPECLTNPPMCLPSGGPGCIPESYFET